MALWLIIVLAVGALGLGAMLWWRLNPSACPYGLRIWVQVPHPIITRKRLLEILVPRSPERILEIGPGTGYYTLDVAEAIAPRGRVDIFDLQQEMLDHTMRRAAERGIENLKPRQGDARDLPYGDNGFDAAFLVTVFGEIPDGDAALRELRRVVRPGGRIVVGELSLGDPHFTRLGTLRRRAEAAGLSFERHVGGSLGYFARFTRQR